MQTLQRETFLNLLAPGMEVFSAGCTAESALLLGWLKQAPERARGVRFTGVWIPGVNRFDLSALDPTTRMRGIFLSADFKPAFARDQFELLTLPYSALYAWLKRQRFDLVMLSTAARDAQGNFPLSLAADFSTAALINARTVVVHANPELPATNGPFVPQERVDFVLEEPSAVLEFDAGAANAEMHACAAHISAWIEDGATLQFGLGKMQQAICEALLQRRNLRIHSGMVSAPLLGLLDAGALASPDRFKPPIVTGVALGNRALYARLRDPALVRFAQVGYTHAIGTFKAIPRFVSINSVIEVDLFGQANGEILNGAQISGAGGMVDFVRGAQQSEQGAAILALPSTASDGRVSRIVARLSGPISVSRADVDIVATEHGALRIRDLGLDARAEALIGLAAPQFRDELTRAWAQLRADLKGHP